MISIELLDLFIQIADLGSAGLNGESSGLIEDSELVGLTALVTVAIPAEGLVPLDSLPDDAWRFDRASHVLAGRRAGNTLRLGDRVRVAVARVDLDRRALDFRLVARGRRGPPPPRPRDSRKKPGRTPKRPKQESKRPKRGKRGRR